IAAVGAGVLVYLISNNVSQSAAEVLPPPTPPPGVPAVFAVQDIEANTVVSTSMVKLVPVPADLVRSDSYTSTPSAVGQTAKHKVLAGEMLLKPQFVASSGRTGASASVAKGKVLVAFPSTDIINSTGAVQAGDHVDILLSIQISGTARLDAGSESGTQVGGEAKTLVSQGTLQNVEV